MQRITGVAHQLGATTIAFGATMGPPLALSFIADDGVTSELTAAIVTAWIVGGLLWLLTRRASTDLQIRDGFLLVVSVWALLPVFAALPLLWHYHDLSFTDAYFEAMSGLTTTGATTLKQLDQMPASLNLWRHEMNWLGGAGIIVLAVAILPMLGVGGRQIYMSETPGPMKESKLAPRILQTVRSLWFIYVGLTVLCFAALKLAGMTAFDALCHAFSVIGLGGFSTHDANIGYFDSPAIEAVLVTFMLVAGVNFSTHFLAWRHKSLRAYAEDAECFAFLKLVVVSCVGIAWYLFVTGTYASFLVAARHAVFHVVSIATDAGFFTQRFQQWPSFAPLWMLFLCSVTACSASTGGGIKMIRTLILYKQVRREMTRLLHPTMVNPMKVGHQVIPNNIAFSVLGFIFVHFMSIATLTFILVGSGIDFESAMSAIVVCVNNAGPGLGTVGPGETFASLNDFQTWVCSLAMLLGRLEIVTLLIVFTRGFWRR